jgi:predicted dehydrogenase
VGVKRLDEIGAAVVGVGFIGVVHVEALRRLGVQVHGVVGSTRERAGERARELGLPPAYESFEAMLRDDRVDAVHITTPNHLHHAQARAALEAGKHVVCEKPLAMTPAESADLLASTPPTSTSASTRCASTCTAWSPAAGWATCGS